MDNNINITSDGEEIIADTQDDLAVELQREALEQKRAAEDKTMRSVASGLKQCKNDFDTLKSDYARAVSARVAISLSRLLSRADSLRKGVEGLRSNVLSIDLESNSMWRQLMHTSLTDFLSTIDLWKSNTEIVFNQLKNGTLAWEDIPACEDNIKDSELVEADSEPECQSGSGDKRESHLFTGHAKTAADMEAEDTEDTLTDVASDDNSVTEAVTESERKRQEKYSLNYIKVSDSPITARQLKLLGYLKRSANAVLVMRTENGVELFYLGSITNNLVVPTPYHAVKPIFDTVNGTYFFCTVKAPRPKDLIDDDMGNDDYISYSKYIHLNNLGIAQEITAKANSHRFIDGSGFTLGDQTEQYPYEDDSGTNTIFQSGQLVWVQEGNIQYLINSELGTVLGYSVAVNLNEEGHVKLSGVSKLFLSRPSLNTIILRDIDSEKEELVSMKAKLVFERTAPYVFLIGGTVFIGPHDAKTTVSTFVPYEVEFGNGKSVNENSYEEYSNGVLFIKDRILFLDSGDYITQISKSDIERGARGIVNINGTLFMMDKVVHDDID